MAPARCTVAAAALHHHHHLRQVVVAIMELMPLLHRQAATVATHKAIIHMVGLCQELSLVRCPCMA
jgi:hypothetical protein